MLVTYKVYYYITPTVLRTSTRSAKNVIDCEREFLKVSGLKKENILSIKRHNK